MKKLKYLPITFALLLGACVAKNNDSEKTKAAYNASLTDSISALETRIDSCNAQIADLREQIGVWLRDFTTVANPREVGSYIILSSFKNHYPLLSTGLIARINDSGQFELIAVLSGKPFDKISVSGPAGSADSVESSNVPNDHALNYRTASYTTVSYTGADADSIGAFVADNELNPLTVNYYMPDKYGGKTGSWRMPTANAKMISYTYLLYNTQRELNRLERQVPMLHEKINLIRLHQDKLTSDSIK